MNTPTDAYLTKFSSGTILALLLLSGVVFLIPLAAPVNAAQNASLPTIKAIPSAVAATNVGGVATSFSLTVTNPSSNAYAITTVTVTAPTGWTFSTSTTGDKCSGT